MVKGAILRGISIVADPYEIQEWIRSTAGAGAFALINIALYSTPNVLRCREASFFGELF